MLKKIIYVPIITLCISTFYINAYYNTGFVKSFPLNVLYSNKKYSSNTKLAIASSSINEKSLTFNKWWLSKINASTAWTYTTGSSSVKIGILDDGIDLNHPNIGNINTSLSCSFVPELSALVPTQSHGTRMAGLITGKPSSAYPTFEGIAPNCELVSLRILKENDALYSPYALACAINYAESNGIQVLVLSYCLTQDQFEYNSYITSAISSYSGMIFCAAGNDYINIDNPPVSGDFDTLYPSISTYSNIVSIASINSNNKCIHNFGESSVDFAAPGSNLWTTNLNATITPEGGTSFATPIAAGSFALLKSYYPCLSNSQLMTIIMNNLNNMDVSVFDYNLLSSNYNTLLPPNIETHTSTDGYLNIGAAFSALANHKTYTSISSTQHHVSCLCSTPHNYGNESHDFELVMTKGASDDHNYIPHYVCTKCNYSTNILPF